MNFIHPPLQAGQCRITAQRPVGQHIPPVRVKPDAYFHCREDSVQQPLSADALGQRVHQTPLLPLQGLTRPVEGAGHDV